MLGCHAQVHFALAPDHHLVAFGIVHHTERRVFLGQLGESRAELDVVLALLGAAPRSRAPAHRALPCTSAARACLPDDSVSPVLACVEFAECDRLADRGLPAFLEMLAHELEHPGHASGIGSGVTRKRCAVAGLAAEQAGDRHLAAVRGMESLQHAVPLLSLPALTPSRCAVSADARRSHAASAFISRSTPLVRVATPISTGQTMPSRNSLARSSNTLSRGGSMSSSSCSISSSS